MTTSVPEHGLIACPKRTKLVEAVVCSRYGPMMLPHPIPYQGSKRSLAPIIGNYVPADIDVWFEPFAGSAAMTLWAAKNRRVRRMVIADSLYEMTQLWAEIVSLPDSVADRYERVWTGQMNAREDYFNSVRARFNEYRDPVDLLYLICRCVKNAVRFNARQQFTQSVDKRRLGMRPDKMRAAVLQACHLLRGRTEVRTGDWLETTRDATSADFIYMDPPYLGTSIGRDKRYAEWMSQERLIAGLQEFRSRDLRFCLSYDGKSGERTYGPPLPTNLAMTQLLLHAGHSSQHTLNGIKAETYESLYLSHGLGMGAPLEAPALPFFERVAA